MEKYEHSIIKTRLFLIILTSSIFLTFLGYKYPSVDRKAKKSNSFYPSEYLFLSLSLKLAGNSKLETPVKTKRQKKHQTIDNQTS